MQSIGKNPTLSYYQGKLKQLMEDNERLLSELRVKE